MKKILLLLFLVVTALQSLAAEEREVFLNALKHDLSQNSDSLRTEIMIYSPIYTEPSSEMSDYIPMFNYLLGHYTDESLSETIGLYLYEMFKNYPDKHIEFEKFLGYLPKDEQNKILVNLTMFIAFEFILENKTLSYKDLVGLFSNRYPFLNKNPFCKAQFMHSLRNMEDELHCPERQ